MDAAVERYSQPVPQVGNGVLIIAGILLVSTIEAYFQQVLQAGEEDDHHPVD